MGSPKIENQDFSFIKTNKTEPKKKPTLKKEELVGQGMEKTTHRVSLQYETKLIKGTVLKVFQVAGQQTEAIESELEKWEQLKQVNKKRKQSNLTTLNLPSTIRGFIGKEESGILMTDLTEGGTKELFDLKSIGRAITIPLEAWSKIERKIFEDLEILEEEFIALSKLPMSLDPWIIVKDKSQDSYRVYNSDIGNYTNFHPHNKEGLSEVKKYTSRVRLELKKIREYLETGKKIETTKEELDLQIETLISTITAKLNNAGITTLEAVWAIKGLILEDKISPEEAFGIYKANIEKKLKKTTSR